MCQATQLFIGLPKNVAKLWQYSKKHTTRAQHENILLHLKRGLFYFLLDKCLCLFRGFTTLYRIRQSFPAYISFISWVCSVKMHLEDKILLSPHVQMSWFQLICLSIKFRFSIICCTIAQNRLSTKSMGESVVEQSSGHHYSS